MLELVESGGGVARPAGSTELRPAAGWRAQSGELMTGAALVVLSP